MSTSTTMDVDTIIARADRDFPALYQLFGGYFHEDWAEEHATPDAAVRAFVAEAPREAAAAARSELDRLLASGLSDAALTRLLEDGFHSDHVPQRAAEWLVGVRETLGA